MDIFAYRLGLILTLQLFWISYLVLERPLEDPVMMNLEILNELLFYCSLFVLPLFTDMMTNAEDRYNMGFIMLGLLGVLVFCNLSAAVYKVVSKIRADRQAKQDEIEKELYLLGLEDAVAERVWCRFCKNLNLHIVSEEKGTTMILETDFTRKIIDEKIFPSMCTCKYEVFNKYADNNSDDEDQTEFNYYAEEELDKWQELHCKIVIKFFLMKLKDADDNDCE
jgi:hypothetical protein